jgi:hypothetical protein
MGKLAGLRGDRDDTLVLRRGRSVPAEELQRHLDRGSDLRSEVVAVHDVGRDEDITANQGHVAMIHRLAIQRRSSGRTSG